MGFDCLVIWVSIHVGLMIGGGFYLFIYFYEPHVGKSLVRN